MNCKTDQCGKVLLLIMVMNCFRGMVDRQKTFSLIYNQEHCQGYSALQISDTPQAGFKTVKNPSSDFVE